MKTEQKENERSGGLYPYSPLAACVPIADAVKAIGNGKSPVSKASLASSLKEDERSQTLNFKLASAKSFGLIEGRTDFSLTETAKRYYFPTDESDRQNAVLDFLESPVAFRILVERFDGSKLPTQEILSNILHREAGVPQSWKDRVAGIFIRSAQFASAMDEQGHLRVKASREGRVPSVVPTKELTSQLSEQETDVRTVGTTRYKRIAGQLNADSKTWSQSADNRTIYIEYPRDINPQEWEDLNRQVQRIKPEGKTK
ncbi:MAG: hypothetical protein ACLQAH_11975 [Limisphaerales bacterium]